jgi:hypothetical protein
MDEGMLRCDRQGYKDRLQYEADMHYNIIRNALGNVAKQEFFDLCDQYGIFIWEEFGLNHSNMPYDIDLWLSNQSYRLRSTRNHACIALWCSANEGATEEPLRSKVGDLVDELDGTRMFLQHSTQHPPIDVEGPYFAHAPAYYFKDGAHGFCPEIHEPTIPPIESMRRMMPHNKLWPINEMWATHDWWPNGWEGVPGYCSYTVKAIEAYGAPTSIEDFCRKAHMVNLEGFKAMYEAWGDKMWDDCTGVMIWMSNPAWPLLSRTDRNVFWDQEGVRTGSYPMEHGIKQCQGSELHP